MRKLTLLLVVVLLLLAALPVAATGPGDDFGGNSEVWKEGPYSIVNTNNPDLRFDWPNHRMAVPGQGGAHADDSAAVIKWGDGTLVDPLDTY